jgi:hypothetical protein
MPHSRIRLTSFARAALLFLSVPRSGKRFPPRLSGNVRKPYQFALMVNRTRERWTKKRTDPRAFLTAEAFSEYVGRIDDLVDELNSPDPSNQKHYKSDSIAKRHSANFVRSAKQLALSREQKREIIKIAADFRRKSFNQLSKFRTMPQTLENIIHEKEVMTGGYARMIAAMLNVASPIRASERTKMEKAFFDAGLPLQIYDDLVDVHVDRVQGTANIVTAVLEKHPAELTRAIGRKKLTPLWMRVHCPRSYAQIMDIMHTYLDRLPTRTVQERAFQALPKLIWLATQFRKTRA